MRTLVAVMSLLAACTGSEQETTSEPSHPMHRYTSASDMYSLDAPDGWTVSQDRGSTIFAAPRGSRHTIVVRSAPTPAEIIEGTATSKDDVVAATEKVLKALPKASLQRRWTIEGSELPAEAFSVRFTPRGLARQYARTHVVVLGDKRVFHVIYTAPVGEKASDDVLTEMVAGLREEV